LSQTSRIVNRWINEKCAVYSSGYVGQHGWFHVTRKGLHRAGLDFRAEAPSNRTLDHLYWINEVRLQLEEENPGLEWISERSIQAEQGKREKGQRLEHIPDGILVMGSEHIDIEVQISKPNQEDVERIMRGGLWRHLRNPLRYYVNKDSRAVVLAAYRNTMKGGRTDTVRPYIEIINLEVFLKPPSADQHFEQQDLAE